MSPAPAADSVSPRRPFHSIESAVMETPLAVLASGVVRMWYLVIAAAARKQSS